LPTIRRANWPIERRIEYFEWCKRVIDGLRGVHPGLEATFDEAYRQGIARV
jgi:guanosine-3',5'-bis(diphosphate) 3'-pyrophosphohydrolase